MILDNPALASLPAGAAMAPYLLVKLSGGTYLPAGPTDVALGVSGRPYRQGETCQPRRHTAGNLTIQASGAIALGAVVVQDLGGKVKSLPTSGGGTARVVGVAQQAAAADGDWIDVEPVSFGTTVTIPA
jgi:hypothetical protein